VSISEDEKKAQEAEVMPHKKRENQMHFESKPCTNVNYYLFVIVSLNIINKLM